MSTARRRPATTAALALALALGLSSCGQDGVLHRGSVAASVGATKVDNDQVQEALADLQALAPNSQMTGSRMAVVLALAPSVERLAAKNNVIVSAEEIRGAYRESLPQRTPSESAVTVLGTERRISRLVNGNAAGQEAVNSFLSTVDVRLNPRYGKWTKGGSFGPAPTDWITATPDQAAQP